MGDRWYRQMNEPRKKSANAPKRELKADIVKEINDTLALDFDCPELRSLDKMIIADLKELRKVIRGQ